MNLLQAAAGQPQQPSPWGFYIMIALMIVVLWLFMWRPESKRRKEMQKFRENLKRVTLLLENKTLPERRKAAGSRCFRPLFVFGCTSFQSLSTGVSELRHVNRHSAPLRPDGTGGTACRSRHVQGIYGKQPPHRAGAVFWIWKY